MKSLINIYLMKIKICRELHTLVHSLMVYPSDPRRAKNKPLMLVQSLTFFKLLQYNETKLLV